MSKKEITLGNLFSGAGTWELAGKMVGIKPLWESEIEPFPVALEAKRFPECIQLGDVTKIDGAKIPPVDVFTNSSPCTNISVAGNREGLAGKQSGLFYESVRIAKEMREVTNGRYPRFWCFENVPGIFSSNKGSDFRTVLETVAQIKERCANVPLPPEGKWHYAGVLDGDDWQIAWRTLDACHVGGGTAQRRRRVYLVADLDGRRAAEVLFKPESVSWNTEEIRKSWEGTSRSLEERINETSRIINRG